MIAVAVTSMVKVSKTQFGSAPNIIQNKEFVVIKTNPDRPYLLKILFYTKRSKNEDFIWMVESSWRKSS